MKKFGAYIVMHSRENLISCLKMKANKLKHNSSELEVGNKCIYYDINTFYIYTK